MNEAALFALEIYREALAAVAGHRLISEHVRREGDVLWVADYPLDLTVFGRVYLAGSGKASPSMVRGLAEVLDGQYVGGLVVTKHGHGILIPGIEMVEASHPVPDQTSIFAGEQMLRFASDRRAGDLVLYCLSGGSSALMEATVAGVDLAGIQNLSRVLLGNGAEIGQINAVRAALSRVKAGALAQAFGPATVVVLVMSDVAGDDLATIGSGPFFQGRGRDPLGVARQFELAAKVDFPLLELLRRRAGGGEKSRAVPHRVIGANRDVVQAAEKAALNRGMSVSVWPDFQIGEARDLAGRLALTSQPGVTIAGGEPTVTIRGAGLGGRCQEMAAVAAGLGRGRAKWGFLAGSTDGTDGPTDVAGGVVDGDSAANAGIDLDEVLATNDSNRFLAACGGLLTTGPTGSNVNDLFIAVDFG